MGYSKIVTKFMTYSLKKYFEMRAISNCSFIRLLRFRSVNVVRYGERSVRWELTVAKENTRALINDVFTLEVE